MTILPDPRRFAAFADDALARLASHHLSAGHAHLHCPEIVARFREHAAGGRDQAIRASLRGATSAAAYRCLWESLARAVAPDTAAGVVVVPFALPLAIVTGGRAQARVAGILADVGRVREVFEASGVLGPARNFGLSNGLCTVTALESLPPSRLYALAREGSAETGALDLPPADIEVTVADEQVHLRFLPGAALTPAHAPSFLETASAIATWGMALTRELSEQLRVEGLSVLPIPRPPAGPLHAPQLGRRVREELAFQAFVSRVLRRFRAEVGEPEVTVAALDSGSVGVRFGSRLAADRFATHVWALHSLDDLRDITESILGLLRECRVEGVQVLPEVVSAATLVAAGGR